MKELTAMARNLALVKDSQFPTTEVIIVVTEPTFHIDVSGAVVKHREVETFRFGATPAGLRAMASDFSEWAEEAEEFAAGLQSTDLAEKGPDDDA